ncbi:MAG: recombinase family protein, partial [Candidatus Saccharimonadales bacterium]
MSKLRYIAYFRKSSESEERQSLSIPAQRRKVKELFPDIKIVKFIEEAKSAFKPGRDGFDEMMTALGNGEADGIVSWHPDRLSRNEVDAAVITYGLRTGLIKDLKFGSYFFDNSPEGIMMLQNVMSHSQYYSSKLSKDVKRGNDEQRKRGWTTGRAIEGYLNARNDGQMDYGVIIKDPERFSLRRQMWDLMLTGKYSVPRIVDIANKQWGYKTRGTKKYAPGPISRNSLYNMFNNPRYAGQIPVPDQPGECETASYIPMVTIEEYDAVQELLGKRGTRKLAPKKMFNYRGTMFCGECGCVITAESKNVKLKDGSIKRLIYYHCTHKRPCTQRKNLEEKNIKKQYTKTLGKYTILPQFKDWALEALGGQNEIESTDFTAILESQSRTIEATHKEVKKLIKMASKELISEEQFSEEKKDLEQQIEDLEEEREDTKKRANSWYATAEKLFDLAVNGRDKFLNGTLEEKRTVLRDLGQNPVILDGNLIITPHPWAVPIENGYKPIEKEYLRVRSLPEHLQKEPMQAVRTSWLGMRDSNPRS